MTGHSASSPGRQRVRPDGLHGSVGGDLGPIEITRQSIDLADGDPAGGLRATPATAAVHSVHDRDPISLAALMSPATRNARHGERDVADPDASRVSSQWKYRRLRLADATAYAFSLRDPPVTAQPIGLLKLDAATPRTALRGGRSSRGATTWSCSRVTRTPP